MTVTISPTPAPKAAGSDTPPAAKDKDAKFGRLIDGVSSPDASVDPAPEDQTATQTPPSAEQSLEALLAALKASLAPGAALLKPTAKKTAQADKPTAKGSAAKEGEDDPAAALLAALGVSAPPPLVAVKALAAQVQQSVDEVARKAPTASGPLAGLADAPAAPPLVALPGNLAALIDSAIRTPEQPAPATAQLDRLVDTGRDAAWLDRLSQDIAASAGAGDRLHFRMMPPNLGALDVAVERQAAGMSVTMTTHTADARNLIADARQQMVDSLKAQGVPLIQLSLSSAGEELERHRPPTFFNHLIEAAPASGTELAAQPVESTTAERVGRFA